ncbi:MAG: HD-GYP domain-containing protein [Pseudomonadota bacterium]
MNIDSDKERTQLGEDLIRTLYRLVQTVKIHKDNNKLLIERAQNFVQTVVRWGVDEAYVTLQISRGRFYVQDDKLRYRREILDLIQNMLHYFEKRGLRALRLNRTIKDASFEQILAFARLLDRAEQEKEPLTWLMEQLKQGGFAWVEIVVGPGTPEDSAHERKQRAQRTYSYALNSVKEVAQKITSQKRSGVRKARRMVQNMVDLVMEDESVLLAMSTLRDYDDYTYAHSVNVAILSMCLGQHISLSRRALERLGICGLFHDLGKVEVPHEILNKPGKLDELEFEEIQKHPVNSVREIVKLKASRDLKAKILLAPFEHHMKYDLSGYPRTHTKKSVSLFGRILAIADVFDAMTSPRVYRPAPLSPDRALGVMMEGAGHDFDPILLKVFINMLGVYPVGTLVQLDNGDMGLVTDTPGGSDGAHPRVVLVVSDGQGKFKKGKTMSLAERDPNTGAFRRKIVKSLHPAAYGIQPVEFLI